MLEIEKPVIQCVESNDNGTYGKFEIEPLERGMNKSNKQYFKPDVPKEEPLRFFETFGCLFL